MTEQQNIGWDNFLCGKLSKQWQIYQHNYEEAQQYHNCTLNRLRELKKLTLKKKKKKSANVFQTLISSIYSTAYEEMWTQHNKDYNNCTSATTVEKIDNQVKLLCNKIDSVLHYERKKYFPITLEQMLQQSLKKI